MSDFPNDGAQNLVTIIPNSRASCVENALFAATTGTANVWPVASGAIFVPFTVQTELTVVKIIVNNGNVQSGNLDVGIYDDQGNRLVSIGSTAQGSVSSLQTLDITDTTLVPGLYYMAIVYDNTTSAVRAWVPAVGVCSGMGVLSMASAFPLPATATFAAAVSAYIPHMALTCRTLI